MVRSQVVAGINAIGRGRLPIIGTVYYYDCTDHGSEAIMQYIQPNEYIRRLAAAGGIDVLNLVKTQQQLDQEKQQLGTTRTT